MTSLSRYGHFTLMIVIFAMLLVIAFGHTPLPEHVKFIFVYTMGSTFLNAAWPSLLRSFGSRPRAMEEMCDQSVEWPDYQPVPLEDVVVDSTSNQDLFIVGASIRRPIFHTLQEQERQRSSPDPLPTAPSPGLQDSQQSRELAPRTILQWEELIHMSPSSNHSGGSSHVGTSLSLGSHGHSPSEMSSIVAHFFPETVAAGVHRHPTQRKRDTAYTSARLLPPSSRRGSSQEHIAFP